ncbi:MAG TPA: ABC transporter permease [Steroidobacteraceae bacterium]|nr:ABC transporter permease [Steroidobacteraceae bacterium]
MWRALQATWIKEARLLLRDMHGLLLLFVMPAAFILIMSLAMDEDFSARAGKKFAVLVVDQDGTADSKALADAIEKNGPFSLQQQAAGAQWLKTKELFLFTIRHGFSESINSDSVGASLLRLEVAAEANKQTEAALAAAIRASYGQLRMQRLLTALADEGIDAPWASSVEPLEIAHAYHAGAKAPTAVQQSVPAWLVFAMFFVAIPVSTTLIQERQLGTLRRLRSTPMPNAVIFLGKLCPYFLVNLLQTVLMLLVGMYLVPLLGGAALELRGSMVGLAIMAMTLSVAALGYALLISTIARTADQATILGGAGSILLAGIGGIMVPKFVMPLAMQQWTNISPMAWGLEGFLQILLREGSAVSVWPYATALLAFGVIALAVAVRLHRARPDE